jgi:hypothetical protein
MLKVPTTSVWSSAGVVIPYFSRVDCIRHRIKKILDRPTATIIDRRKVFVTYKGEDEKLDYIYFHRFKLLNSGKIAYNETVECYDRHSHISVGTAGQDATLHRLTTALEERAFAQPSSREILEGELSTSTKIRAR